MSWSAVPYPVGAWNKLRRTFQSMFQWYLEHGLDSQSPSCLLVSPRTDRWWTTHQKQPGAMVWFQVSTLASTTGSSVSWVFHSSFASYHKVPRGYIWLYFIWFWFMPNFPPINQGKLHKVGCNFYFLFTWQNVESEYLRKACFLVCMWHWPWIKWYFQRENVWSYKVIYQSCGSCSLTQQSSESVLIFLLDVGWILSALAEHVHLSLLRDSYTSLLIHSGSPDDAEVPTSFQSLRVKSEM